MSTPPLILCLSPDLPSYAKSLQSQDSHYVHCANPADFQQALEASAPDLILSDFSLPGLDLQEVRMILKAANLNIPFIATPQKVDAEIIEKMMSNGASDCIAAGQFTHLKWAVAREVENLRTRQSLAEKRLSGVRSVSAQLAHDFNNILAPVTMSAPMLKWELDDAEFDDIVDTLEQTTRMGSDTIRDLLIFGRGVELQREEIIWSKLLEKSISEFRETLPQNIHLEIEIEDNLPPVFADLQKLKKAFQVLLDNAREAMPDGGQIRIKAGSEPGGKSFFLSVRDQGKGIDPAIEEKIFDPFFSTKRHLKKGSGLGLSIALGLVKSHKGNLTVANRSGKGCTFRITLPRHGI